MKRLLHYINSNLLLKIASFNSVAVLTRVVAGFVTSKAIAVFIGAEGLALIGNLRNVLTTLESFSTLGFSNGIVKYVAEYKGDKAKVNAVVGTVLTTILVTVLIISVLLFFNAESLGNWIFDSPAYVYIIKLLAFALPFSAMNLVLMAIINGLSKHKTFVKINIYSQIVGLFLTLVLIWQKQLDGALIAAVTIPALLFFLTFFIFFDIRHFLKPLKISQIHREVLKNFSQFSAMALFSAAVMPLVFVMIRNYLIEDVSMKDAGFWEAIRRISNYYLMFVNSLLALYILPRFSEISMALDFRKEVVHFYKTVLPIFGAALIGIYFLRSYIIAILFTKEFQPVEALFMWQLLGDFLKVISSVLAFQLIAKKKVIYYIGLELFSLVNLYLLSIYFIDLYGVKGVVIAHFVSYVLYFIAMLIVLRKPLFSKKNFAI